MAKKCPNDNYVCEKVYKLFKVNIKPAQIQRINNIKLLVDWRPLHQLLLLLKTLISFER